MDIVIGVNKIRTAPSKTDGSCIGDAPSRHRRMMKTSAVIAVPQTLPAINWNSVCLFLTYLLQQTKGSGRNIKAPQGQRQKDNAVAGPTMPMACRLIFHLVLTAIAKSVLRKYDIMDRYAASGAPMQNRIAAPAA